MTNRFKTLAIAAALAVGTSGVALAQVCPPGYFLNAGMCQPAGGYNNPVSGTLNGADRGAARGDAAAGPVGAVVGGALGAATGAVTGAANTAGSIVGGVTTPPPAYGSSMPPACAPGYVFYSGACYPR